MFDDGLSGDGEIRSRVVVNALGRIFGWRASEDRNDPMAFLDEYAAVMNRHTGLRGVQRLQTGTHGSVDRYGVRIGNAPVAGGTGNTASMRRSVERW